MEENNKQKEIEEMTEQTNATLGKVAVLSSEYSYGRSPQPILTCCFLLLGRREGAEFGLLHAGQDVRVRHHNCTLGLRMHASAAFYTLKADTTLKRQNKRRRVYMGIRSCLDYRSVGDACNIYWVGKCEPNDAHHSKDKGSADSDDGLPPLERNFNRISLEENDYEMAGEKMVSGYGGEPVAKATSDWRVCFATTPHSLRVVVSKTH
ncbi:hypothetical protein Tco_0007585 [Tanacetum coccineum]